MSDGQEIRMLAFSCCNDVLADSFIIFGGKFNVLGCDFESLSTDNCKRQVILGCKLCQLGIQLPPHLHRENSFVDVGLVCHGRDFIAGLSNLVNNKNKKNAFFCVPRLGKGWLRLCRSMPSICSAEAGSVGFHNAFRIKLAFLRFNDYGIILLVERQMEDFITVATNVALYTWVPF